LRFDVPIFFPKIIARAAMHVSHLWEFPLNFLFFNPGGGVRFLGCLLSQKKRILFAFFEKFAVRASLLFSLASEQESKGRSIFFIKKGTSG